MADFFAPGFDQQIEQQNIDRQRQYAQALRQQGAKGVQGQMVGRTYVAPSWTQGLAQMLQAYQGRESENMADEKQKALADAVRGRSAMEMGKFTDMITGKPASEGMPANEMDSGMDMGAVKAQAPNLAGAYKYAAGANTPALQQIGVQGALSTAQAQAKLAQDNAERQRIAQIIQSAGSPQSAIAAGVPADAVKAFYESPNYGKEKGVAINGQLVNPLSGDSIGKAIPKQANPVNMASDLLIPDGKGGFMPNAPLVGVKKEIGAASKPVVSVDARQYNTQETEQSKAYGKSLGEIRANINQAGYDAPKKIAQLNRMEELLKGVDGGAAAPTLAAVASYANSMGIKLDPKLGPKEAAIALARDMAGSLRQPGTGPMTDKDFDNFLAQIPDLSKSATGRAQIMKTMRGAVDRDLRASKFARDYAQKNKGVIDDGFFDALSNFYAENPVVTPAMPATNQQGVPLAMPKGFDNSAIEAEIARRRGAK